MSAPSASRLSPAQLQILQHSLGVDQYGQGRQYRNHFVTGEGSTDWAPINELVAAGYMKDHGAQQIAAGSHCFTVTPQGINAVAFQSPRPPKVSRARQRWRQWLDVSDCYPDTTFGEWLKMGGYKDALES